MARSQGLQHFIESKAAGPAFAIAAACVILRGAVFWSGGAFSVAAVLGTRGVHIFDGLTGVGVATGAELLASIFGRQWLRYKSEAREAAGRGGLRRAERAALVAEYTFRARLSFVFALFGVTASTAAGFAFLHSASGASSLGANLGELAVTVALVSVLTALGTFYEARPDDAGELATEHARALRARIVEAAGQRIARGDAAPQDIRLVAKALPRREQDRFISALLPESADDPAWSVADLADWLGADTPSGRRQLHRRLSRLAERGAAVTRDDRGSYRIPRSVAVAEFAGDFVKLNRPGGSRRSPSSVPAGDTSAPATRQTYPPSPLAASHDSDAGTTTTDARQVPALVLASSQEGQGATVYVPYTPHVPGVPPLLASVLR